jgi:hypothetical protein
MDAFDTVANALCCLAFESHMNGWWGSETDGAEKADPASTPENINSISGLVVKSNVANVGPRVRFSADAKSLF